MRAVLVFLQDALRVRPEEVRRTLVAFVYLFTTIGAFITARIVKSALFLEIPDYREQLPLTYIGIAITVSLIMSRYARVERRLRRDLTNIITLVVLMVVTLGFRWLLHVERASGIFLENPKHEVYWAFLLWAEIMGAITIVQFWSLIPEIFNSRQAKRLFALIGGGGVLANIAFGKLNKWLADEIGTENLLLVIVACLVVSMITVAMLSRDAREELTAARDRAPATKKQRRKAGSLADVFATRHVQLIALVIVLTFLVSAIVDYQFTVIVGDSIAAKDERSAFFSDFFAYTGIIAALIQFTMTSRILEKFGVLFALMLLPLCMLGGTATMVLGLIAPLYAASVTKGSENVLRYTLNDSTLQLLYLPVPTELRGRSKAIIDGILKPLSTGLAGLITALLVGSLERLLHLSWGFKFTATDLGWLVAATLVAWGVALVLLRREYLRSLVQTLQRRRLNFEEAGFQINDESTLKTLEEALGSKNVGHVLHALELLPHVERKAREPFNARVAKLVMHEADEVRVAALQYLTRNNEENREEVAELLDDSSREVRAAAVLAYCAARREKSIDRIHGLLEDWDQKVQAAAVAGLIRYGGFDGILACADLLKRWLSSENEQNRRHAAWVLGEVGVQNFYQPLIPLLADPSERVRQDAIVAAGRLKNRELIEPLIEQLGRPRLNAAAVVALAAFGAAIEDVIARVLDDEQRPSEVRTQACRILARLGDSHSAEILTSHLRVENAHIRAAAVQALVGITQRLPGVQVPRAVIDGALREEAEGWFRSLAMEQDLRLGDDAVLLRDALGHRRRMAQAQILTLLGLKYPRETMDLVATNLQSKQATTRANAVEVLDNMLEQEKVFIVPIFDDAPADRTLHTIGEVFDLQRQSREARLVALLEGSDPWLRVCAAQEIAARGQRNLVPNVKGMLHGTPVARETAVYALSKLLDEKGLREAVGALREDADPRVRRYAAFALHEEVAPAPVSFTPGALHAAT